MGQSRPEGNKVARRLGSILGASVGWCSWREGITERQGRWESGLGRKVVAVGTQGSLS